MITVKVKRKKAGDFLPPVAKAILLYITPFLGLTVVLAEKILFPITESTVNMDTTGTKQTVTFFDIFRTDQSNNWKAPD